MPSLGEMYHNALLGTQQGGAADLPGAIDRVRNYNAQGALDTYTRAATDRSQLAFRNNLRDLKGSEVRNGRLNTGFFDEDVGQLALDSNRQLNDQIGSRALEASQMQQTNDARYLGAAEQQQQQYFDLLTGGLDREQAEKNRQSQQRSSLLGSLASLGGTAIGFLAGGPPGAGVGGSVGGNIFRGIAGMFGGGRETTATYTGG